MATAGIRGEIRMDTASFAEDVKRVARGAGEMKDSIERINDADLTPLQKRIGEMFETGSRRYTAEDLFSRQQRSFAVGNFGDMRNVEGFKGAETAAGRMRQLAAATGRQRGGAGLAFLEFSRAVEDAQYGIRGVMNNIPQMALMMGAGAGLTGVVSLLAVGVATLGVKLWDWVNMTKEAAEAQAFLKGKTDELSKAITQGEREALNGSVAGRQQLADASAKVAQALAYEGANRQRLVTIAQAQVEAQKQLALARVDGDDPTAIARRGEIEITYAQKAEEARIAAIQAEIDIEGRRAGEARKFANEAESKAKAARDAAEKDFLYANPAAQALARNKAAALEEDARQARRYAEETASTVFQTEARLSGEKIALEKSRQERTAAIAIENQKKVADAAEKQAQAQIDAAKAQDEKYIEWRDTVDATLAKEKEKEQQSEEARQKEREAIAARIIINQARARGDEEEARKLEKKVQVLQRINALKEMGFSPQEAEKLAVDEAQSADRIGKRRIGRPGRGKIEAGGIDGGAEWNLDKFRDTRNRASLRDELDQRIGDIGDEKPKMKRETRVREGQARQPESKTEKYQAESTSLLREIAAKIRLIPISTGGDRNYVALP